MCGALPKPCLFMTKISDFFFPIWELSLKIDALFQTCHLIDYVVQTNVKVIVNGLFDYDGRIFSSEHTQFETRVQKPYLSWVQNWLKSIHYFWPKWLKNHIGSAHTCIAYIRKYPFPTRLEKPTEWCCEYFLQQVNQGSFWKILNGRQLDWILRQWASSLWMLNSI